LAQHLYCVVTFKNCSLYIVRYLAFIGCLFSAPAFSIEVETTRAGDLIEVKAYAIVTAPVAVIWSTLTDYERLPEFIPGLFKSKIISRSGATVTVAQSGEAQFLFFKVPIEVTVESTERPPYLEVKRVSGTVKQLYGRYETEAVPNSGVPGQVQLRWIGAIEPEAKLPPLVGEALMRKSIREQFTGMVREIERRARL
jgi:ribosome-associated toxin RatA of RatAB toxin-antitoxin module